MGYAGNDYGSNGSWNGAGTAPGASGTFSAVTTAHASGMVVVGALLALILIRAGFRGVNVGGASLKVG